MRKILAVLLAMAVVLSLAVAAFADNISLYTKNDEVKGYALKDTGSAVLCVYPRGMLLVFDQVDAGWYRTHIDDPNSEGKLDVWVRAADLSTTPPCNHAWGDWIVTKAASCTAKGERIRICATCKEAESEIIDYLSHSFRDWQVRQEATCTATGVKSRVCAVCGFEQTQTIPMLPHSFSAWKVTTEATDHSSGVESQTCQSCGLVQSRSFDPEGTLRKGTNSAEVREIQNLLADQGYLKSNLVDGSFGSGTEQAIIRFQKDQGLTPDGVAWPQTIRRLHHDFGEWTAVIERTRFTDGEYIRVCKECSYTEHKTVASGLSFSDGDMGNGVKTVQRMLNELGFRCGQVDGAYGAKLETAWQAFAKENELTPEPKRLRAGDLDALTGAWLRALPEGAWQGEGDKASPVNLILTVAPAGEKDGQLRYEWRLSNLGTGENSRFIALLFSPEESFDPAGENMVLALDNVRLNANGDDRLSGSFTIPSDWLDGEGTPCFCAIAIAEKSNTVWCSNAIAAS